MSDDRPTLYNLILDEFEERRAAHVQRYPPYFICSIGSHLFNLANIKNRVYFEAGLLADTRVHLMFVAPPGYSKTFWLHQFIREGAGVINECGIETGFEQYMTEAGWIGTIKFSNGEPAIVYGAAHHYARGIVGIEEFSAVTEAMKSQHSKQLDTALLTSLDSGIVRKRLAAGPITYTTGVSLWCGTQPSRFDLSSGLGRRLIFLQFVPSNADKKLLTKKRRIAKNIRYNPTRLAAIRAGIKRLKEQLLIVKRVTFSGGVYRFFDNAGMPHFEEPLYERLLIGYHFMTHIPEEYVTISIDKESMRLLKQELLWRDQIRRGGQFAQVMTLVRDAGGTIREDKLKDQLTYMGLDWSQSSAVLRDMIRNRAIRIVDGWVSFYYKKGVDRKRLRKVSGGFTVGVSELHPEDESQTET